MNDLRLLLENVQHNIALLNRQCNFEAERYEDIAKPWRIKITQKVDEEVANERSETRQGDEYSEELQKVNDLLKKARFVRQKPDPVVKSNAQNFDGGEFCKDCRKGYCKNHKKTRPLSHGISKSTKERLPDSISSTSKVKQNTKIAANNVIFSSTGIKNYKGSQQQSGSAIGNTDGSILSSEYEYIKLEDILSSKSSPSKYRKLQNMHRRLKANKLFDSTFAATPVESELRFISKLVGESSLENEPLRCNNGDLNKTNGVYTKQSCEEGVKSCTRICQNLINALQYKLPSLIDENHKRESVTLYREKLLYTQVDTFLLELEEFFNRVINSLITNYDSTSVKSSIPSLSFLIKDEGLEHIPCKYLSFERTLEPVCYKQTLHELLRLKLNTYLKERIHEYLQLFLYERARQSKDKTINQRLDKDFATSLSLFFGLLAKKNRCSINPAVVWEN